MSQQSATGATLAGIANRFRRKRPIGVLDEDDRVDGKTCLVTGANAGLGKAIATEIARRGGRVIMAGHTLDESARDDICGRSGNSEVSLEYLDLADLASVLDFVDRQRGQRFDISVLNAGVVPRNARRTIDGLEEGFQVNFLATFLLVGELLSAGVIPKKEHARVVFVSSESHRSADAIDWQTFGEFRDFGVSGAMREYGRAKLLTCTHAAELARRLDGDVAVHALCPGAVNTRLAREAPVWSQPLLKVAFTLFFRSPEAAATPAVYLSCARSLKERTAIYLHVMEEKPMAPLATDPTEGAALWRACNELLAELGPAARSRGSGTKRLCRV
jgi:NAD(P)-dependent dehydrogenase (short-subunit alcohol dehydrogenase family)